MPQRSVATNFTFEQQRTEINLLAADFWNHKTTVDGAATSYLKHNGSNDFTGGTLNVPNVFTISSNSGNGTVTIAGNLQVDGTTTTVNTATMDVVDKNITIAKGSANDAAADGAGITIDSATDITLNFVDANDAWVSSIGLEATTFLKGPYGQFTGSGTPATGQGVEVNAPDANTGQIISYDRGNSAYKDLRLKGSSVGVYTGTTNALEATFSSTGLSVVGNIQGGGSAATTGSWGQTDWNLEVFDSAADCYTLLAGAAGAAIELRDTVTSEAFVIAANGDCNLYSYKSGDSMSFHTTNGSGTGKRLTIDADGNVGINNDSPTTKLSVDGGTADDATVVQIKNDSTSAYSTTDGGLNTSLSLFSDGTNAAQGVGIQFYLQKSGETGCISEIGATRESNGNSNLVFRTRQSSSGVNERMRLSSDGKLLIGAQKTYGAQAYYDDLTINNSNTADGAAGSTGISLLSGNNTWAAILFGDSDDDDVGSIKYSHIGNYLRFTTNGATRMELNSDGDMIPNVDNTQDLGSSSNRWAEGHINWVKLGTNGSWLKENNVRFQSGGEAYIDHATVGQGITFRTSNSASLDTSAMFLRSDGRLQVYCLNNSSGLELNVGGNAGTIVLDRNGHITSNIRASDKGSNVAGGSGGGSRVNLNKEYIQWYTFPYTTNIGDAPTYTERMRLWNGGLAVGARVGDANGNVWSNQPAAFQSARVNPDGASAEVHTAQRCNLYVGSNTGWASGDGGVIGLGGSGTGNANEERLWAYIKGSRQSGNGWEYPGYLDLGTQGWNTNNTEKRQRIWADGQVEWFPTDNTMMSWKVGGAQRMKFTHTGGGNIEIDNSNGTMTYDTGSDYRLKKDEVAITDALTTVKALKPYQFTYKSDNRLGQGFFAHEAQAVLPDVGIVSGTKDAVHTEDDKNEGYKKDDPIYQGIDYSKLVPLLTAALQEATAKIEILETKVAALESA